MKQRDFFTLDGRFEKLNDRDSLLELNKYIDWECFRPTLDKTKNLNKKSTAGRKRHDPVMMFKGLILQHLFNLSDAELEFQIRDRYTFCRFLGLYPEDTVPDANSFWDFRERLKNCGIFRELFLDFEMQLEERGFKARKGQIIDASFVEVPRQRNSREENDQIKAGETPESFTENPHKESQKDIDARWAKKNNETYFGYKDHVSVDNENKLIWDYEVTPANVHDSQVFTEILAENTDSEVWADSAYKSEENESLLDALGYKSEVHAKASRNRSLTKRDQKKNRRKSKTRARVEHVFGSITNEQGGLIVRTIGLARAKIKIGLINLTYNMRRFAYLCRIALPKKQKCG